MNDLTFLQNTSLLILLCSILIILVFYIIFEKKLLNTVFSLSIFSAIISCCYLLLDSPDVAMTEVALGAALSSTIMLNAVKITATPAPVSHNFFSNNKFFIFFALIVALIFVFSAINLSTKVMPFGSVETMLHKGVNKYYIANTYEDTGVASMVAAILASYRGYDTLGETIVILLAAIAVIFITFVQKESCKQNPSK
ncbi:MAG: DUF4040 domain-containing protein [Rickettsiaceae bacterium]|nr:DUF4040 domain-containing protein [Rickettsiaceae bacterium]